MPYTITTHSAYRHPSQSGTIVAHTDRTTVATLDEAREAAARAVDDAHTATGQSYDRRWEGWAATDLYIGESGGMVGPLPDGTVIEARPDNTDNTGRVHGPADRQSRTR